MVSTESAAATLPEGADVDTDANIAVFERLSVLFELSDEQGAIVVLVTQGLAGQPGLAGELARRWEFVAIDLTSDADPFADPADLGCKRVLVGMSLLSPERRREWLIRLNRGRDRIAVLGLHVVLLLDEVDVRVLHEIAPDFASRVHELLEIDASAFVPARVGVLSPLGPVGRPDVASVVQPELLAELSGLGIQVIFGEGPPPSGTAIDVAWRFADSTHAWVAWIERERWDDERITRWLTELGIPRLLIVFGGDVGVEVRSDIASMLWIKAPADRVGIKLTPELATVLGASAAPSPRAGGVTWLIHDASDRDVGTDIARALDAYGLTVVRSEDDTVFKLRAHFHDDIAIVLLSPAALGSRKIAGLVEMLRPREHWRPKGRSIVLLDRVSSAKARELVGPDAKLLTLRSPGKTADEIVRVLAILRPRQNYFLRVLLIVARPPALPLLDPRRSVAPIAEALVGLETQVALYVLVRPSFREIVKAIQDAHGSGVPFKLVHIDACASSDDNGQVCIALDGEDELSVPLVQFAVELYGKNVGLCILDLHWPASTAMLAPGAQVRDLLKVGVQRVIASSDARDPRSHHEFIAGLYETIVSGESIASDGGSSEPLVPDLRQWRQTPIDDGIAATDGFVGRFDELLELDGALRRHPLLVIYGAEGVGKSALAAEFARWQRQMRRFDEVIWLTPEHATSAVAMIATGLLSEWDGDEVLLRKLLSVRRILLVLDAWDEWSDRTILDHLAVLGHSTRILMTTRERPVARADCFALQLSPRP